LGVLEDQDHPSTDMIVSAMLRTFIAGALSIAAALAGLVGPRGRFGFFDTEVSFFAAVPVGRCC
jgi:hypothetical protein